VLRRHLDPPCDPLAGRHAPSPSVSVPSWSKQLSLWPPNLTRRRSPCMSCLILCFSTSLLCFPRLSLLRSACLCLPSVWISSHLSSATPGIQKSRKSKGAVVALHNRRENELHSFSCQQHSLLCFIKGSPVVVARIEAM
jgi:hypothetical protein